MARDGPGLDGRGVARQARAVHGVVTASWWWRCSGSSAPGTASRCAGRPGCWSIATIAFVLANQAFGLLIIAWTANLRMSLGLGALIFGPAVAFSGVTFPLVAMPVGARIWAETLPLTHAMALIRAGVTVGAPETAGGPLLALALTTAIAFALALPRLPALLRDPELLGPGMRALGRAALRTLRTIGHDQEMLSLLVVASVFYSLFYPTPYLRQVLRDVPVLVVDRDQTPMSRRFARWLDATEGVAVTGRTRGPRGGAGGRARGHGWAASC